MADPVYDDPASPATAVAVLVHDEQGHHYRPLRISELPGAASAPPSPESGGSLSFPIGGAIKSNIGTWREFYIFNAADSAPVVLTISTPKGIATHTLAAGGEYRAAGEINSVGVSSAAEIIFEGRR